VRRVEPGQPDGFWLPPHNLFSTMSMLIL